MHNFLAILVVSIRFGGNSGNATALLLLLPTVSGEVVPTPTQFRSHRSFSLRRRMFQKSVHETKSSSSPSLSFMSRKLE
ncbi:hypothetical protein BC827DRAFT_1236893 [Russula dissimulans]|nr:hypothetical protein BC827DRAFT_1236893 [Russula dissimulans]